jgi:hypothetical protein
MYYLFNLYSMVFQKQKELGVSHTEGGNAVEHVENLFMAIVQIGLAQQKCDHSGLYLEVD